MMESGADVLQPVMSNAATLQPQHLELAGFTGKMALRQDIVLIEVLLSSLPGIHENASAQNVTKICRHFNVVS